MKHVCVIGAGFSGVNTVINLIKKTDNIKITLINNDDVIARGVAYNPYSKKQLLNVTTNKMSIFDDESNHFLDWVMLKDEFKNEDKEIISHSFLSRKLYGDYLVDVWEQYIEFSKNKNIDLNIINDKVSDMDISNSEIKIFTKLNGEFICNYCVIATGNEEPDNPKIENKDFFKSQNYFKNPWDKESVKNLKNDLPILIIGNGLTMVDTIIGLEENNFKGEIYSISPNGFNILSHKHIGLKYTKLTEELDSNLNLFELVKLINKHIKNVKKYGISAEPIIDSLRPYTQKLWGNLTPKEKDIFMKRLRHLWGVARHRIPQHIQEKIQNLRLSNKLHIISGKIINLEDFHSYVGVEFFNKKNNTLNKLKFSRVINCTGPNTNILDKNDDDFLKKLLVKGMIKQDDLKLGICANTTTYQLKNSDDNIYKNIFVIGSLLKGELWESTAVNEIRKQSEIITNNIIDYVGKN